METLTDAERQWLKDAYSRSIGPLMQSGIMFAIYTKNAGSDPIVAMQLGIAILFNKPIFVLAAEGLLKPGDALFKAANSVAFYKPGDEQSFQDASQRLLSIAIEAGLVKPGSKAP